MSSATLQKSLKIVIGATGLTSHVSKRGIIDGIVFFGRKKSAKIGMNDPNAETTSKPVSVIDISFRYRLLFGWSSQNH
jgi:hypothetical protein